MRPFNDFRNLLTSLTNADDFAALMAGRRFSDNALMEREAIFAQLISFYAAWRGQEAALSQPLLALFAATHGINAQLAAVRQDKKSEQAKALALSSFIEKLAANQAVINHICFRDHIALKIFDLALSYPTMDISQDAAIDERSAAATMAYAMESVAGEVDIIALYGFGDAANISAASLACLLYGKEPKEWLEADNYNMPLVKKACSLEYTRAISLVEQSLARHQSQNFAMDSFDLLRSLGGREFLALAGAIIAARMKNIPVILDGPNAVITALVLAHNNKEILAHCLAAGLEENSPYKELWLRAQQRAPYKAYIKDNYLDVTPKLSLGASACFCLNLLRAAWARYQQIAQ